MEKQPEALRLAEQLDNERPEDCEVHAAAAELRRLLSEALRIEGLYAEAKRKLSDQERVMQQALEALENAQANVGEYWPEAVTSLREQLAR